MPAKAIPRTGRFRNRSLDQVESTSKQQHSEVIDFGVLLYLVTSCIGTIVVLIVARNEKVENADPGGASP